MHLFKQHAVKDIAATTNQIPVIDYGPYFAGVPGALEKVAAEVKYASENIGFFYAFNHGIPQSTIDAAFAASQRFHALPMEEKRALSLNAANIGYLAPNTSVQAHTDVHKSTKPNFNESFFVSHDRGPDHPDVRAGLSLRGMNQWPPSLPDIRAPMMDYVRAMDAMCNRMLAPFAVALGMPADSFDPLFANEAHVTCRFLHYPPQDPMEENQFGQAPHTDNSFMTALARTDVPGLAVRLPSGEWFPPPIIEGTYLINLGNMMRRFSNNRFLATPHGVLNESGRDRYSIAYFHSPNPSATIAPLPSCVSADNPPHYQPAVYRDLIMEFFRANYFHQKGHKSAQAAQTAEAVMP